jgi:hypothetical protein
MITCHISSLESRCRERGYTLEQVRPCIVRQDGDQITVDETHPSYPRAKPGLAAVGITPERVSKALGVKDCGCKKRQQRLNDIGRRIGIG